MTLAAPSRPIRPPAPAPRLLDGYARVAGRLSLLLVFAIGGGAFAQQLSGIDTREIAALGQTSPRAQIVYAGCYALLILYGLGRPRRYLRVLADNWLALLLPALAIVSALWAPLPLISLRKSAAFLAGVLSAYAIVARLGPRGSLRFLGQLLVFLMIASLLYIVVAPGYGVHQPTDGGQAVHVGEWRGVFVHRTQLGRCAALCLAVLVAAGREVAPQRWLRFALIALAALILVKAGSGGAALTAAVLLPALGALHLYRATSAIGRLRLVVMGAAALLAIALAWPAILQALLLALGKDASLTGRLPMWRLMLESAAERPLLGYGYSTGFLYSVARGVMLRANLGLIPNAQNGYLDVLLNLGIGGLIVMLGLLLRQLGDGLALAMRHRGAEQALYLLPLLMGMFFVEANVVEAWIVEAANLLVMIFYLVVAATRRARREDRAEDLRAGVLRPRAPGMGWRRRQPPLVPRPALTARRDPRFSRLR